MKILLVITGLGVGGAERLVTNLADRYVALGHEVTLAYFHGEVGLRPSDERVRLVCLDLERSMLGVATGLWNLRKLIRSYQPDVLNSHMVHPNILCRLLRLVTPVRRLVSSAHNTNEGGQLRMLGYRATHRLADAFTNVSEEAVQAFVDKKAALPGRMTVLLNGVDTDRLSYNSEARQAVRCELAIDGSQVVFLAVGRLEEQKDYPNLLSAVRYLVDQGLQPLLLIVGDGLLRDQLEALVESLALAKYVRFLGVRQDIVEIMSACDCYVMSSAWEGLPMVILEAMACERLVVATDCGGVKEAVGDIGTLVPPENSSALAKAMGKVFLMSEEKRATIGGKARARARESYSLDATVMNYLDVYKA